MCYPFKVLGSKWMIDCSRVYNNVHAIIKRPLIFEAPYIVQLRLMPPKWRFRSPLLSPRVRLSRHLENHRGTWISASRGKFYWLIAVVLELRAWRIRFGGSREVWPLFYDRNSWRENLRFPARCFCLANYLGSFLMTGNIKFDVYRVSANAARAWKAEKTIPQPPPLPEAERKRERKRGWRKSFIGSSAL